MVNRFSIVVFTLVLLMTQAAAGQAAQPPNPGDITAQSSSKFGLALIRKLGSQPKNLFICPLSIHTCLEMALAGAKGKTEQEMANVLALNGRSMLDVESDYSQFINKLTTKPQFGAFEGPGAGVKFEFANSLWSHKSLALEPSYVALLKNTYKAECAALDFASPSAPARINSWVSQCTHGKIKSVIQTLDPAALLVLVNAAYFKAHWEHEFSKSQTRPSNFTLSDGRVVKVPTMSMSRTFAYFEDNDVQVVSLPYTDSRFRMYIVLPKKSLSIGKLCSMLTPENWSNWKQCYSREGALSLPKFKLEYQIGLKSILAEMGMPTAFSAVADFSKITARKSFISDVIHKTFVDVNEEGTEAAAVTAIPLAGAGFHEPQKPFSMVVDRPFFFALESDSPSDALIFAGTVVDPR